MSTAHGLPLPCAAGLLGVDAAHSPALTDIGSSAAVGSVSGEVKKKKPRRRRRAKRNQTEEDERELEEGDGGQPASTEASNELLRRNGWPVEVRYGAGRGRYAVAASDIAAGAVVLRETAFAAAVAAPQQGLACHSCFRYAGAPLRLTCPRCRQVSFCSPACATPSGRAVHPKAECEALQRLHAACNLTGFSVDEVAEVRLLIRILVLRWIEAQRRTGESQSTTPPATPADTPQLQSIDNQPVATSFSNFMELMSNKNNFGATAVNRFRQRAFIVMEAFAGDRATNEVVRGLDVDEVVDYIGRLESNTFARYHATKRKTINYGSAMFNCAAMFNHSCFPSVVRQFDGQHLTLRALRPLKKGEELTMTYIPLREDTPERQNELQQHYHFACRCQRCEAKGAEVERYMEECLLCPNDKRECDGLLVCLDEAKGEGEGEDGDTRKQHCLACGFSRDIEASRLRPTFAD